MGGSRPGLRTTRSPLSFLNACLVTPHGLIHQLCVQETGHHHQRHVEAEPLRGVACDRGEAEPWPVYHHEVLHGLG